MYAGEPRIIPALLLDGGQLVKTRNFRDPVYVGDAINVLSIFNDFEVDEIVLLDVAGARRRRPTDLDELRRYAEECFIPLAYGGGLTTDDQIAAIFAAGYEKVILNSALADDPGLVERAATRFGRQAVVASIDVTSRGGTPEVRIHGGADTVSSEPVAWAPRAVELGAGELLVTSIDREGTHEGFDLELIE